MDNRDPTNCGWHSRGYLPHFDAAAILQTIVFRLNDSLPVEKLNQLVSNVAQAPDDGEHALELYKKLERWVDAGYGDCHLRNPRVAAIVQNNLLHFDGARYKLLEWVIMPNHVHVLIETKNDSLKSIIHSWKSYTAKRVNSLLKRTGTFWAADYFDRYIRNERHYYYASNYIRENPVKAGLCARPEDWLFGSAAYRAASHA